VSAILTGLGFDVSLVNQGFVRPCPSRISLMDLARVVHPISTLFNQPVLGPATSTGKGLELTDRHHRGVVEVAVSGQCVD
jgi:hypothetical protein